MSNTLIQVPAHILARQQTRQQAGVKNSMLSSVLGDFSFPKISTRASRYRLVEDGVETVVGTTLDVVIVGVNQATSKVFYSKPFDGNLNVSPDCVSSDGIKPDATIQNPVCSSCAACPNNILGSRVNPSGAASKLCADQRHIAVVPAADPSKVYSLTIAVSAFKSFREYFRELQNFGLVPQEVVTELGFDDGVSFPKVTFTRKGYVPDKALPQVDALIDSPEVLSATRQAPPTGAPQLAAPAQPAAALASPAKAPKPKPAPAPEPVAAPEPEVIHAAASMAQESSVEQEIPQSAVSSIESQLDSIFG